MADYNSANFARLRALKGDTEVTEAHRIAPVVLEDGTGQIPHRGVVSVPSEKIDNELAKNNVPADTYAGFHMMYRGFERGAQLSSQNEQQLQQQIVAMQAQIVNLNDSCNRYKAHILEYVDTIEELSQVEDQQQGKDARVAELERQLRIIQRRLGDLKAANLTKAANATAPVPMKNQDRRNENKDMKRLRDRVSELEKQKEASDAARAKEIKDMKDDMESMVSNLMSQFGHLAIGSKEGGDEKL